jgi:hypothetical protein
MLQALLVQARRGYGGMLRPGKAKGRAWSPWPNQPTRPRETRERGEKRDGIRYILCMTLFMSYDLCMCYVNYLKLNYRLVS